MASQLAVYRGTVTCDANSSSFAYQFYNSSGMNCRGKTLDVEVKVLTTSAGQSQVEFISGSKTIAKFARLTDRFLELDRGAMRRFPTDEQSAPLGSGFAILQPVPNIHVRNASNHDRKMFPLNPNGRHGVTLVGGTRYILAKVSPTKIEGDMNGGLLFRVENFGNEDGFPKVVTYLDREPKPSELGGGTINGRDVSAESRFELVRVEQSSETISEQNFAKGVPHATTFKGGVGYGASATVMKDPWTEHNAQTAKEQLRARDTLVQAPPSPTAIVLIGASLLLAVIGWFVWKSKNAS